MASNCDKEGWNGDGGNEVLRPALKTKTMATTLRDESRAAARVSRAARLGVRLTRVLGALIVPGGTTLNGKAAAQQWKEESPGRG